MASRVPFALAAVLFILAPIHGRSPDERVGIGVDLRIQSGTGLPYVVIPIKGSPAHRAGIQAGDLITTIRRDTDNSKNPLDSADVISTRGLSLKEINSKLLGLPNSKVTLFIQREGKSVPIVVTLTRQRYLQETIFGATRKPDASFNHWIDRKKKIAYIRIVYLGRDTPRELESLIRKFKREKMKGLILDLRFCPGGLLTSMTELADLFIADGLIVTVRRIKDNLEERWIGKKPGSHLDFPMAVLINPATARAAEGIAACLQDHKRAAIIGERSEGNGGVQNIQLLYRGEMKLTVAVLVRPSGKTWHRFGETLDPGGDWGIKPDKGMEIKLSLREREELFEHLSRQEIIPPPGRPLPKSTFRDVQLEKALEVIRQQPR